MLKNIKSRAARMLATSYMRLVEALNERAFFKLGPTGLAFRKARIAARFRQDDLMVQEFRKGWTAQRADWLKDDDGTAECQRYRQMVKYRTLARMEESSDSA